MTALASPLLAHLGGYRAGRFVAGTADTPTFTVTDPATGATLATLPMQGAEEARLAVEAAAVALRSPPDLAERARILTAIAESLDANEAVLAELITLENGKPLAESRGEVAYSAGFYRDAASRLPQLEPEVLASHPRDLTWTIYKRPAGVAALITPWNFPLAMLAKKLAGALAAGCPVVVKPSELTPLSCIAFFALLHDLDLPAGLVNLVFGDAPAIGEVLCTHPAVQVISFTGSTAVGKLLSQQAAPHLKRMALELGGNAPFLVFEDADLELAADALMANKFRCGGQTCVCSNRVYVARAVLPAFEEAVVRRVATLKLGPGLEEGTQVGPLIDGRAWDKVARHVKDAVERGARVALGGVPEARLAAAFFPPTVLSGVTRDMVCTREETFGPVVAMSPFDDEDAVLREADDTEYGLAAYVFTADPARAERVLARLHFGHVGLNTASGPTPEAPFGGMRHSGLGREGGLEGVMEFVELQTVPSPRGS